MMILYNKFHRATLVYTHLIVQDDCNFIITASEDFLFLKIITHIILFLGHINTFCIKKGYTYSQEMSFFFVTLHCRSSNNLGLTIKLH